MLMELAAGQTGQPKPYRNPTTPPRDSKHREALRLAMVPNGTIARHIPGARAPALTWARRRLRRNFRGGDRRIASGDEPEHRRRGERGDEGHHDHHREDG